MVLARPWSEQLELRELALAHLGRKARDDPRALLHDRKGGRCSGGRHNGGPVCVQDRQVVRIVEEKSASKFRVTLSRREVGIRQLRMEYLPDDKRTMDPTRRFFWISDAVRDIEKRWTDGRTLAYIPAERGASTSPACGLTALLT